MNWKQLKVIKGVMVVKVIQNTSKTNLELKESEDGFHF